VVTLRQRILRGAKGNGALKGGSCYKLKEVFFRRGGRGGGGKKGGLTMVMVFQSKKTET